MQEHSIFPQTGPEKPSKKPILIKPHLRQQHAQPAATSCHQQPATSNQQQHVRNTRQQHSHWRRVGGESSVASIISVTFCKCGHKRRGQQRK